MRWRNLGRIGTGLRVINRLRFDRLVVWEKELTYGGARVHSLKVAHRPTACRAVGGSKVLTKGPSTQYERRRASFIHQLNASLRTNGGKGLTEAGLVRTHNIPNHRKMRTRTPLTFFAWLKMDGRIRGS